MNSQDRKEFKRLQKCKLKSQAAGKLKEEAELCNVLGELLSKYGEYEEAITEHQHELQLSESVQDVIGAAVANRKIGECHSQLGHYKKALRHQGRHLELARSVDNYVEEQRAHATIGRTYLFQGENIKQSDPDQAQVALQKARESFFKSLEVCGHLKGVVSERELMEMKARLYLNIGLVYDNQRDNVNSAKFIKQAVFIAEKHHLLEDLYRSHCSQGDIYHRMGESTKALRSFENAMKVAKKLKEKNWESEALSVSANVLLQLGDFTAAKRALKKAYKLGSGKPEERDIVIRTLKATIRACRLQEELDDTSDVAYRERLPLYEALGDLCCKISVFTRAAIYYKKQLSCAMALQCGPKELVTIYVSLATTYADDGQHRKAIEMYRKELELRKGHPKEEGRTWLNIADAQEKSNHDFETVSQSYKNAVECAKKAQHSKLQLLSLRSLSLLHKKAEQELLYGATMEKIHRLKEKEDIASDDEDELSDEDEGEGTEQEMDSESWEMDNLELSDSDVSDVEEEYDRSSATLRARKSKFAKRNEKGETLLHRACIDGNLRQVKKLLLQGHPVNPRDYCGWIPLHEACNFGHVSIVEVLLDHGADISDRGGEGCSGITPLHDAINGGNFEVAELLVARGASVQARDDKGVNALDTMQNWMETYAGDLDQSTRQDAERMFKTLRQVHKHGNHHSVPARPRNILENTDLFDREESRSQDVSRQSQPSTSYNDNHHHHHSRDNNKKQTGSGRDSASATAKQQSHASRNGSSLRQRNVGRGDRKSRADEESDDDHFETLGGAESENDSDESMDITEDSLPVMTSHIRTRVAAEKPSTSYAEEKTLEGDDLFTESEILEGDDVLQIDDIEVDENVDSSQNEPPVVDDARQSYISAVSSVGSAATRLSLNPVQVNAAAKTKPTNETPALIPEEEYTGGDDWLIQDIATQPNKRKRMDLDYMMRNNDRAQSSSALSGPSGSQLRASQKSSLLSRKSKRSRQMKLTSMGAGVVSRQAREGSRVPSPLFEEDSRPDSDTDFSPVQEVDEEPPTTRHLDSTRVERPPAPDHHPGPSGAVMRVRVKIQDKTFLIPIREATNTMSWLCEEAAKRHFASSGLRPKLQLCTGEGAMFSPDDVIADLLNNNEEVIGKVETWDLPPLTERYKRACQNAKTVEHPKILSHLQQSQTTPATLELNSLVLKAPHLKPLFLALQCQYSLRKLILPGNRIGDATMATLTAALKSLPNLAVLDLSCNGISQEGLKLLQEGLTERIIGGEHVGPAALGQSSSKPIELLEELNLSYNPLTDACAPYLAALIQHCSLLSNLALTSCDLTTKLFQLHRRALTEAFQGANNLRTLHISHNALGSTGVELLLRCLSSEVMSSLDLSCVIVSSAGSNLAKHLVAYLSLPDCSLKELRLSGCHLGDQDIFDVNRCLPAGSQLTTLDLSSNVNITEASICQLLQVTTMAQPPLESLDLSGCGLRTPLSTDFLASLSLNLVQDGHKRAPLKGLRMCGNKLSKGDCELLIGVWEEAHGSVAMHHVDSTRCVLYVRE